MNPLNEERFSQEEVAEILRLANNDTASTGTLSRTELLAAAEEAGLDPFRVEQAIEKARPTPARTTLSEKLIIKEFDFGVRPDDLPTVLCGLPTGAERMIKVNGGLVSTWFDEGITRYHVRVSANESNTRLEVRVDRTSQYAASALIFLLGMVAFFIATNTVTTSMEALVFVIPLGLLAQAPIVGNKRKSKVRMQEFASRLETHLRNLAGR